MLTLDGQRIMDGLTAIQEKCLRAICRYVERHGVGPTRRELAKLTGQKSVNGVRQLLVALQRKGYVAIVPARQPRNIRVVQVLANEPSRVAE